MKTRSLAVTALICLLGTVLWLVLMIAGKPADGFAMALAKALHPNVLFYLTYLNAAVLVTVPATLLMAGLYTYCKGSISDVAALAGLVFTPVYAVFNLLAYLSQITVVPVLVELYNLPESRPFAEVLLRLTLQEVPDSAMGFINGLAYAVLGIPSIVFGIALYHRGGLLRAGGVLLALNGVACLLGFGGMLFKIPGLDLGIVIGGGLFLLALIPLTWGLFKESRQQPAVVARRRAAAQ